MQGKAGRGNGKSGRRYPDDRNGGGEVIQLTITMYATERDELDALAVDLKINRSHLVRVAVAELKRQRGKRVR